MSDWQPPEDVKPWMVCAAVRYGGVTVAGPRHFDEFMHGTILAIDIFECHEADQGFIDQWGRFYTREEAMEAVKASGQPFNLERNGGQDKELFSEGLY